LAPSPKPTHRTACQLDLNYGEGQPWSLRKPHH
jgi:hypothetical protein